MKQTIKNNMFCKNTLVLALFCVLFVHKYAFALQEPPQVHFVVKGFDIIGSNPLSESKTQSILNKFTGEHYGLDGLQAAADELESSFREHGHAFYRVNLVPQELNDGIVKFEVTQFNINTIQVEGNQYFSTKNILGNVSTLKQGLTPNTNILSRAINMANEQPSKNIKLTFSESELGGAIDAKLTVKDQNPNFFFFNLNNTGTDNTGEYRLTSAYTWSNLFDADHSLVLTYTLSPDEFDAVTQFGAFYSMPYFSDGSKLSFYIADSDVETGIINNFEISGSGTVFGATYNKRLLQIGSYKQEFVAAINQKDFESTSLGATTKVTSSPLMLTYKGAWLSTSYHVGFHVDSHFNISGGSGNEDADYLNTNCPGAFSVVTGCEGSADWSVLKYGLNFQYFHSNWIYRIVLEAQQTSDQLIPGEKFGVGGSRSVRGYEERAILGDTGIQINLEAWMPAITQYNIRPLFFYDTASIERKFSTDPVAQPEDEDLASFGTGLRWSWNSVLSVTGDVGYVTKAAGNVDKGDIRLHIDVFYRL